MVFLLDSNAVSDLMREHARVEARIQALDPTDKVSGSGARGGWVSVVSAVVDV